MNSRTLKTLQILVGVTVGALVGLVALLIALPHLRGEVHAPAVTPAPRRGHRSPQSATAFLSPAGEKLG